MAKNGKSDRPGDDEMVDTIGDVRAEREKITAIETAIAGAKKKRVEVAEITESLEEELKAKEFKLYEALKEHRDELTEEEDRKGNKLRVYRNGDFYAAILDKETLQYDITKEGSTKK